MAASSFSAVESIIERFLVRWLRSGQQEAPVLLTCWNTYTLHSVAQALALLAVCERDTGQPCQSCRGCKLAAAGNQRDVITLMGNEKTISIEAVRLTLHVLSRTPVSPRRLVIVPHAERLSVPAANAFLKTLEETTTTTRIVLTTRYPRRLLATIRSRCHIFPLSSAPRLDAEPVRASATAMRKFLDEQHLSRRLSYIHEADTVSEEDLLVLAAHLDCSLRDHGPSPTLRAAFMRLRDYFVIRGERGSSKMAAEVLIATMAQVDHTAQ